MAKTGRIGLSHFGALGVLSCSLLLAACSGDDGGGSNDTSGGASSGGAASGGASSGGAASGGSSTGGTATGGAATGGSPATGGSTSSGGSSAGDARFACMLEGEGEYSSCLEYSGPEANVDTIRDASNCVGQGGTELAACPSEGAFVCTLALGAMTNSTYYYGYSADDATVTGTTCESLGGTFTPPPP